MPLVLEESQFEDWMRGPPELAAGLMKPYAGAIEMWPVSSEVGQVRNNRPELVDALRKAYARVQAFVAEREAVVIPRINRKVEVLPGLYHLLDHPHRILE